MYNSEVIAFDSYFPEKIVTNEDLSNVVETSDEWIYSRTGIKERRISLNENTSDLCAKACMKILNKANVKPEELDIIIVATVTPDYLTPSTACIVQSKIGAKNAFAFDISAACSGFVYAVSIADKFIKSGIYKNIIVICGETLSKILDWSERSTCVLFGDGAGGVLVKRGNKSSILAENIHSNGNMALSMTAGYLPVSNTFNGLNHTDKDFYIKMNGRDIFNFVIKSIPKNIKELLEKACLNIDDIKFIVPHQANARLIEAVAKKLKIDISKFYLNIDKFGNTSSASIPMALSEMSEKGLLSEGDKIIITGFGSGLTLGSILMEI